MGIFGPNNIRASDRQGGTTGAGSWQTTGTSNTSLLGTLIYQQYGSVVGAGSGTDITITYPTAYSQAPLLYGNPQTANAANVTIVFSAVGTTTFKIRQIGGTGVENMSWLSVGQ